MLTRIIGDIHSNWSDYKIVTKNISHNSIQVGDFGIGFNNGYWDARVNKYHGSGQHKFIRGNHDHPVICKQTMVGCIKDGTIEDDVLYIGGAKSINHASLTEGKNWWKDEELSYVELDAIVLKHSVQKPRILITHDCPTIAAYRMFISDPNFHSNGVLHTTRTGEALQSMTDLHQPEFHFFGHWHATITKKIGNTTYVCLGIMDYIDVDLADSNQIQEAITEKFNL